MYPCDWTPVHALSMTSASVSFLTHYVVPDALKDHSTHKCQRNDPLRSNMYYRWVRRLSIWSVRAGRHNGKRRESRVGANVNGACIAPWRLPFDPEYSFDRKIFQESDVAALRITFQAGSVATVDRLYTGFMISYTSQASPPVVVPVPIPIPSPPPITSITLQNRVSNIVQNAHLH